MADKLNMTQIEAELLKLEGEGVKLHLDMEKTRVGLEDLRKRRDALLNARMDIIRDEQLTRMGLGLAKPNVVNVPAANLAAPKGN